MVKGITDTHITIVLTRHNITFHFVLSFVLSYNFFLGKFIDLSNNDDVEAVLDILYQFNPDFGEDDDADEIWTALNVNTEAESSDDTMSREDLFSLTNDQCSDRAIKLHRTTNPIH